MAKRGENIYKRKDGRYEGRYIKGYKPDRKLLFGYVYSTVKKQLLHCKANFAIAKNTTNNSNNTFSSYSFWWLKTIAEPKVKQPIYSCYRTIIKRHLSFALGTSKLTSTHIAALQKTLVEKN